MNIEDIAAFVREHVEPLPDDIYGPRFRCSATLKDGVHLPCVVVQSAEKRVDLAMRRLEETRRGSTWSFFRRVDETGIPYRDVVRVFAASGNRVSHYDIQALDLSRFAVPLELLRDVHGETSMAWTQFQVEMRDGACFDFGTSFLMEFFDLPEGYELEDMVRVIPAPMGAARPTGTVYRERPFFTCFLEGVEFQSADGTTQ